MSVLRPQVHVSQANPETSTAADASESTAISRSWASYRPVPVFNAADLVGEALAGLIQARREQESLVRRPEHERLAAAESVLSSWPVEVVQCAPSEMR